MSPSGYTYPSSARAAPLTPLAPPHGRTYPIAARTRLSSAPAIAATAPDDPVGGPAEAGGRGRRTRTRDDESARGAAATRERGKRRSPPVAAVVPELHGHVRRALRAELAELPEMTELDNIVGSLLGLSH